MSKRSVEDQVFELFDGDCTVEEAVSRLSLAKTIVRRRERVYEEASVPVKKVARRAVKRHRAKVDPLQPMTLGEVSA